MKTVTKEPIDGAFVESHGREPSAGFDQRRITMSSRHSAFITGAPFGIGAEGVDCFVRRGSDAVPMPLGRTQTKAAAPRRFRPTGRRQRLAEDDIRREEQCRERSRIARDLHDTLLQSFQGVLLKFSTVKYMMRVRPDEAEEALERTIEQARAAITEARDAVQGLRSSTVVANDLARSITSFGEGLAADQTGPNRPEFRVFVEGKSKELPPLVRDEVFKIACESLRNAFRHAQAARIEVQIRYDPRQFRLQLVDNGKGIDPAVLSAGGRAGHHGLPGLHERAELAGGKLSVWSQLNSGTEIELTIPASIAYTKSPPPGQAMFAGKETG